MVIISKYLEWHQHHRVYHVNCPFLFTLFTVHNLLRLGKLLAPTCSQVPLDGSCFIITSFFHHFSMCFSMCFPYFTTCFPHFPDFPTCFPHFPSFPTIFRYASPMFHHFPTFSPSKWRGFPAQNGTPPFFVGPRPGTWFPGSGSPALGKGQCRCDPRSLSQLEPEMEGLWSFMSCNGYNGYDL